MSLLPMSLATWIGRVAHAKDTKAALDLGEPMRL